MDQQKNVAKLVEEAETRIRPYVRQTILDASPYFSQLGQANVLFKCENLQHTGSFKTRGAMNKLLALSDSDRAQGIVTASTGNHGMAVAFSLSKLGAKGIVFVPGHAESTKTEAIERYGVEVRKFGSDSVDAETEARRYARKHGIAYISPYNDWQVMAGQGTIGVEIERQRLAEGIEPIDAVFVSVGGGGLIAGIAGYLKNTHPDIQIIGCSPENSQVMFQSVKAGQILDLPSLPTLSDGTAGGVEEGSITFELCRDMVDDYVTVTENEIAASLVQFMESQHMLIEGSAAVAIAAYLKRQERFRGKNVVIVLCGANISLDVLKEVITNR